jgi:hypothetical protein
MLRQGPSVRRLGRGGLMGKVWWSDQAAADLKTVKLRTRNLLKRNAEKVLHVISPHTATDLDDEGVEGEIMWHRGDGHGMFKKLPRGPQDYFLVYKRRDPASGSEDSEENPEGDPDFEVLAVYSVREVACIWVQMGYGGTQSL